MHLAFGWSVISVESLHKKKHGKMDCQLKINIIHHDAICNMHV